MTHNQVKPKKDETPAKIQSTLNNEKDFTIFDFNVLSENGKHCFLGKGSFASVFKSVNGRDGKVYALKIVL